MDISRAYEFELPKKLVAQAPVSPRDHARLLVYRIGDGHIVDARFYDLPKFLNKNTTLVLNNGKVEHCRWLFNGGSTELFVLEKTGKYTIKAMTRPGKKFKSGATVTLDSGISAEVLGVDGQGIRELKLNVPVDDERLSEFEHVPLPPYIKQDDSLASEYQTVFAGPGGSLAAPTAGLHFTEDLLRRLRQDWPITEVTLNVGLGTFAKLTQENFTSGRLHEESFAISKQAAAVLNKSEHLMAVGTTVLRTLESAASDEGKVTPRLDNTDIFIRPGYRFKAADSLITNFHLPSTSLLMLVAAFIADKRGMSEEQAAKELKRVYAHAIANQYRFYSFGDAMLLV